MIFAVCVFVCHRPQEIAWLVAYLASPAGDYITGQTLAVDGGKTLWGDTWPIADPGVPCAPIAREAWEVSEGRASVTIAWGPV